MSVQSDPVPIGDMGKFARPPIGHGHGTAPASHQLLQPACGGVGDAMALLSPLRSPRRRMHSRGGFTRLHSLCLAGDSSDWGGLRKRAEVLIKQYGVDCETELGNTPLHFASANKSLNDLAVFLLHCGADPCAKNREGETPLHFATIHGSKQLFMTMAAMPDVDVDIADVYDATPLHWAIQQAEDVVSTVRLLLIAGARVDARDDIGDTPLHYAARDGLFEAYEVLLSALSAKADPYNSMGLNPFHAACETDQDLFVQRFVKRYPDLARRRTRSSAATGLHVAVRARSFDVVVSLLASDLKDSQLEAMDIYGRTPLAWAAVLGYTEIVEVLEKAGARWDLVRLLLTGIPQYGDSGTDSSDSDELVSHRLGCNTQYGSLAYDGNARDSNGDRCSCGLNIDELYLPSRSFA